MFLAIAAHALAFLLGLAIIVGTLVSAVRTFVVPRSVSDWLTWSRILAMRRIFDTITLPIRTYLFKIPYNPTPTVETERISISRAEFALLSMSWPRRVCRWSTTATGLGATLRAGG